jgi:predicted PurR-regulated permease PerM
LQGGNYFNLQPTFYALLVVGLIFLVDQIFDNLVNPTLMGRTLGVHPAAVLVSALIAARLIGIIGLMLVTPVLATLQLIGRYVLRKMLDMDPWQELTPRPSPMEAPWLPVTRRIKAWWRLIRSKPTE